MPLPPKLLKKGVTDMGASRTRRMSGTAYGTVVLHVCAPKRGGGAPRAGRERRMIELDVEKRRLVLLVAEDFSSREERVGLPAAPLERGYWKLYFEPRAAGERRRRPGFLVGRAAGLRAPTIIDGRI